MKEQKGFTLYISVVVSAIVLLGAYAVSESLFNQQMFSSDYMNSQAAFALAEVGVSCTEAYDIYEDAFNTEAISGYESTIKCGDTPMEHNVTPLVSENDTADIGGGRFSKFEVHSGNGCAHVIIDKEPGIDGIVTLIISKGYNVCEPGSDRRVQRTIRATY